MVLNEPAVHLDHYAMRWDNMNMRPIITALILILANTDWAASQTNATYIGRVERPYLLHLSDTNNVYLTRFVGGRGPETIPEGTWVMRWDLRTGTVGWGQLIEFSKGRTVRFWREETVRGTNGTITTTTTPVQGKYVEIKTNEYRLEMNSPINYLPLN